MTTISTSGLTWPQANFLAGTGSFVRRAGWGAAQAFPLIGIIGGSITPVLSWLAYDGYLWKGYDQNKSFMRIVTSSDFTAYDYLATDWTTDPVGTGIDVCSLPSPVRQFSPPAISVKIDLSAGIIVTLGPSVPSGSYQLRVYMNAGLVAYVQATDNSTTTVPCSFPTSGTIYANVGVISQLPLPSWSGIGTSQYSYANPSFSLSNGVDGTTVNIVDGAAHTSLNYGTSGSPISYGDGAASLGLTICNTLSIPVTLVIAGSADDDVMFNGGVYEPDAHIWGYYFIYNAVGHRNAAHSFSYTTTLAPGATLLIQGQDNGYGGSINCTITVS